MRRKDREVKDMDGIFDIVERCNVVHLGMVDNGKPYVVALNFGYEREGNGLILYLHCAMEGRKIDILLRQSRRIFPDGLRERVYRGDIGTALFLLLEVRQRDGQRTGGICRGCAGENIRS